MRASLILAILLFVAGTSTSAAQVTPKSTGFCRIYRTMTIGTAACYYCLSCENCTSPTGYIGSWNESTGSCVACGTVGAGHCLFGVGAPGNPAAAGRSPDDPAPVPPGDASAKPAHAPRVAVRTAEEADDAQEPEVLFNPDFTSDVKKWNLTITIPGEGTVKALLVTATVKPKKKGGSGNHPTGSLGFAVRYGGDLSAYPAVTAVGVKEHLLGYQFKFREDADNTMHNKKCTIW